MAEQRCEQCGEMVDAAKAFCPACGNAFVKEEKRETQSNFERHDSTVQLGQTMYNQMLSDMGLNIKKTSTPPPEKRAEIIAPLTPAAPKYEPVKPLGQQQASSEAKSMTAVSPESVTTAPPAKKGSFWLWIIAAAALLIVGFIVAAAIAALFVWYRTQRG